LILNTFSFEVQISEQIAKFLTIKSQLYILAACFEISQRRSIVMQKRNQPASLAMARGISAREQKNILLFI
jgi:hypothetical protein